MARIPQIDIMSLVEPTEAVRKPKKDGKWKRKLIEKLKGIVRRLDRIERQKKSPKPVIVVTAVEPPLVTTTVTSSTTPLLKTSISTPAEDTKVPQRKTREMLFSDAKDTVLNRASKKW